MMGHQSTAIGTDASQFSMALRGAIKAGAVKPEALEAAAAGSMPALRQVVEDSMHFADVLSRLGSKLEHDEYPGQLPDHGQIVGEVDLRCKDCRDKSLLGVAEKRATGRWTLRVPLRQSAAEISAANRWSAASIKASFAVLMEAMLAPEFALTEDQKSHLKEAGVEKENEVSGELRQVSRTRWVPSPFRPDVLRCVFCARRPQQNADVLNAAEVALRRRTTAYV